MLSPSDRGRLVIVQGPPGTGKTSVIGTCVAMAMDLPDPQGLWLVAQSNVAVKNIAEKLISIDFDAWKLLVSKDFIYEWHEHLYNQNSLFRGHLIRSDQFKFIKPKELKECKVILCTLSMLSNQSLSKFTKHIPLKFLIVDEASQIEIGNYYHVFDSFSSTLRKVCFIGDDKQLPPHGEEDLESLKSIFEVEHLQEDVIFLDTQ
ncbi:P-loop containing nucleoside triphosphate hydrolase protein [Coprinopsis sp. MPI-PUGE-AT-0042]|nr:P-loop containing nucleoside triphosphate hydrolase protein [Coprinopsis sp. MPI-PUGE-AT-0042]